MKWADRGDPEVPGGEALVRLQKIVRLVAEPRSARRQLVQLFPASVGTTFLAIRRNISTP